MADLCEKGAVEPAPSGPSYYSRLFVTPQVTLGWKPVIDLSRLNRSVLVSWFHMDTTSSVLQSLRPGDWMVFLDLQDAYLQVLVHPSSRHYLRFCVGDLVLQFRALCFGLLTALRCSRGSWPLYLPSCTVTASGSCAIWTIGLSSGPHFRK